MLLSLFLLPLCGNAQKTYNVLAPISDAFTGELIDSGAVEVLTEDSAFVCNGQFVHNTDNGVVTASFVMFTVAQKGKYILHITSPKYQPLYETVNVNPSRRATGVFYLPESLYMRKKSRSAFDRELGAAEVTATKIKMVTNGDTIVYNADAFQMSQGSMLDALIEQLPGATLSDEGVIKVNGEVVNSLLVNGRDFFKGDPRIALDNLPAYMVDKVKVFDKKSDLEEMTGEDDKNRNLVMDVRLKKQYSIGWIANAEGGYGTDDRYMGRVFALRFSDCSRLAIFANANNTNDTRKPGRQGDWTPSYQPTGLQASKSGGLEYAYENRKKTLEWTSNLTVTHTDNTTQTNQRTTNFLSTGDTYGLTERFSDNCATAVSSNHHLKVKKHVFNYNADLNLYYNKSKGTSWYRAATLGSDPYSYQSAAFLDSIFSPNLTSLQRLALNRSRQSALSESENWGMSLPFSAMWLPFMTRGVKDVVFLSGSWKYGSSDNDAWNHYLLDYPATAGTEKDFRNRYHTTPSRNYAFNVDGSYHMQHKKFKETFTYGYTQDYKSGHDDLYRLDRLTDWGEDTENALGALPSTIEAMQEALDVDNSAHAERWTKTHKVEMKLEFYDAENNLPNVTVTLPFYMKQYRLRYERGDVDADFRKNRYYVLPSGNLIQSYTTKKYLGWLQLSYNMTLEHPDLVNALGVTDDSDPLYIEMGNPNLKTLVNHDVSLNWRHFSTGFVPLFNATLYYNRTRNAIGTLREYNSSTGGYTVSPLNVNGNWKMGGAFSFDRQFGYQKRFTFSSNTTSDFNHSVDFTEIDGATTDARSTVRNLYSGETLSLHYSNKGWNLGLKAKATWRHATSSRADFTTVNAWDYNYGLSARVPLPWGVNLSTDLTMFSRRGYEEKSFNTDDLVWNARLERTFLKGSLTVAVDGFDILGELSNVRQSLNEQARVETWYNTIPRYGMLHLIYKLNLKPKKK